MNKLVEVKFNGELDDCLLMLNKENYEEVIWLLGRMKDGIGMLGGVEGVEDKDFDKWNEVEKKINELIECINK